jgi:hypothetical protein
MNDQAARVRAKQILRAKFMNTLYEAVDGNTLSYVMDEEIWKSLGAPAQEMDPVVDYLSQQGLLERKTMGGHVAITHAGIMEVEQSRSEPDQSTEHFPAQNMIFGDIINSQISQGSPGSHQTGTFAFNNKPDVAEFITQIKAKASELGLDAQTLQELRSDTDALQSQVDSGRPKAGIVKECLSSVRRILEGATAKIIADPLLFTALRLMHAAGLGN